MGIEEIVYVTTTLLIIVGALNWGAYALGHNLVKKIGNKNIQNSIYYLIAGAGVVSLVFFMRYKGWKEQRKDYVTTTRSVTPPTTPCPKCDCPTSPPRPPRYEPLPSLRPFLGPTSSPRPPRYEPLPILRPISDYDTTGTRLGTS
jgi:uncharacterized membrane protein YuzA (DUF378 family)